MFDRPHWRRRLELAWRQAPIVWLTGVRRVGKTVLARSVPGTEFLNCDLPSSARRLEDPERFFASFSGTRLILDEVHQLPDPSRVLKIAADAFPELKVLATGSSTLAATRKFRDSLTGRKPVVELLPVLQEEIGTFGIASIEERLSRGGLPQALLEGQHDDSMYSEWLDSYFARDVQELFRLRARSSFLKLVELVLRQSGGMLEVASLARHVGVSRPSVMSWLEVLQVTHVVHLIRPYAERARREILAQPKLYGFDTGFVRHARGWDSLRPEDCGILWEHLVLDELLSIPVPELRFWRDKQQREIDFVLPRGRSGVDAIECKWNPGAFDPRSLRAFRELYPKGRNFVVSPGLDKPYERRIADQSIHFCDAAGLRGLLPSPAPA